MTKSFHPSWLKHRGYLHLTPQIEVDRRAKELFAKITNNDYVAQYAFFPLIHSVIKERKYKRIEKDSSCRSHKQIKNGKVSSTAKCRPLHYATHMDSLIFGYYAELIQKRYEKKLAEIKGLSKCITAYRKIRKNQFTNKSTIDFAKEVFDEIKMRAVDDCVVLMFDIENFFSTMDHELLKIAWIELIKDECIGLKTGELPKHHYNVFKAATRFSYVLLDDLRINKKKDGKRAGFDEKKLADIRKKGVQAFFESPIELKNAIKNRAIQVHKYPFKNKAGQVHGIPQGLPISAVLANIYLIDFDKAVLNKVVYDLGGFYRRYSDDIIIICKPEQEKDIEEFINSEIKESKVKISENKTEKFYFKNRFDSKDKAILTSNKICNNVCKLSVPLTYLGFEFHGNKTLVKSSNLAKFYRRMIFAVKRKAKIAIKVADKDIGKKPVIFKKSLYRLYTQKDLSKRKPTCNKIKKLIRNSDGVYEFEFIEKEKKFISNYLSYIKRASIILKEKDALIHQIRNHRKIFNQAIQKHLKRQID